MTLREFHEAAIRNVPMGVGKETVWFQWWLLRGGYRQGVTPNPVNQPSSKVE